MRLRFALLSLGLLVAPSASAQLEEGIARYRVKRLAEMSGIHDTIEGQSQFIQQTLGASGGGLTPAQQESLTGLVARTFVVDSLYQEALRRIQAGYDADRVVAVTSWLQSAESQAFHRAQREALKATQDAIDRFYGRVNTDAQIQARRPLIQRLDAAMGATRQTVEASLLLAAIRYQGDLLATLDGDPRLRSRARADSLVRTMTAAYLDEIRPQVQARYAEAVLRSLLFTFRKASPEQLEAWIGFFESNDGRWYTGVLLAAVDDSFAGAVAQVEHGLAGLIAAK